MFYYGKFQASTQVERILWWIPCSHYRASPAAQPEPSTVPPPSLPSLLWSKSQRCYHFVCISSYIKTIRILYYTQPQYYNHFPRKKYTPCITKYRDFFFFFVINIITLFINWVIFLSVALQIFTLEMKFYPPPLKYKKANTHEYSSP